MSHIPYYGEDEKKILNLLTESKYYTILTIVDTHTQGDKRCQNFKKQLIK